MFETLTFDAKSVRSTDRNGNLHVAFSHITKAQVRPYRGEEIPNWRGLGLDPTKIYKGYCPPEELSKKETIESTNGIPIQLNHHADYADDPKKDTRIGSTGDQGKWNPPYLDNSLHFQDEDAIKRIKDGSMRELSLSYRYTPDFTSGTTPDGEDYDFVMRDITANHVALVEKGRAGRDVLVEDKELEEMDDEKNTPQEDKVALAHKLMATAKELLGQSQSQTAEDEDNDDQNVAPKPTGKEDMIKKIISAMVQKGMSPDNAASFAEMLKGLADMGEGSEPSEPNDGEPVQKANDDIDEPVDQDDLKDDQDDDDDIIDPEEPEAEDEDGEEDEDDDDIDHSDELLSDALKACGMDEEPEEIKQAFAAGLKYGDNKSMAEDGDGCEGGDPKKEKVAMDSALKDQKTKLVSQFKAIEEVAPTLGKVRFEAFDSAEGVYMAALKAEGFDVKGLSEGSARDAYRALMLGKKKAKAFNKKDLANDAEPETPSILSKALEKIM